MIRKTLLVLLVVLVGVTRASSEEVAPKVTLSTTRVAAPDHVIVRGTGFTPKANITSHLVRPDGAEYPVLNLLTNDKGEFTHDIDTIVLTLGTHELWVVDDISKNSSNRVQFVVTSDRRR